MLTKDFTIKVFSVVLAFVLWLYVMSEENPEIPYEINNVPVKLVNINTLEKKGLALVDEKNYTVNLKVSGRRSDVLNIAAQNISAVADLSRVSSNGTNAIPINIDGLPRNVTLVSVNPSDIKVDIDNIAKLQMPVNVKIAGNVMDGYAMQPAMPKPGEVLISGPESKINVVKSVVAQVNVSYKKEDVKISVPAVAIDREGREVKGVNINPNFIEVNISVNRSIRVPVTAKIFGKPQDGYDIASVNVLPEYVYITGDDSVLSTIKGISTKQIDITGKDKPVTETATFDLPDGIKLVKSDNTAKVYIDIQKIVVKDITLSSIDVKGAENKNVTIPNPDVVITVSGPESIVNSATPADFNAYVDAANVQPGIRSLPVNVTTNLNLKIEKIKPDTVTANIQ